MHPFLEITHLPLSKFAFRNYFLWKLYSPKKGYPADSGPQLEGEVRWVKGYQFWTKPVYDRVVCLLHPVVGNWRNTQGLENFQFQMSLISLYVH